MPVLPRGIRRVAEEPDGSGLHVHPGWAADMPWVTQGITGNDGDMSLFGGTPTGVVVPRWQRLRDRLVCPTIVHARQVHRNNVLLHTTVPPGLLIGPDADGHATRMPGVLLAVSVADCVPIFIVASGARAVALLHGGWRGVAAGILESGVRLLQDAFDADPSELHMHCGPSICGDCYEVGPEVAEGLGIAGNASHVDLRANLAERAIALGIDPARVTTSKYCTRHGESPFYSHRGGCAERQIAVLALRPV